MLVESIERTSVQPGLNLNFIAVRKTPEHPRKLWIKADRIHLGIDENLGYVIDHDPGNTRLVFDYQPEEDSNLDYWLLMREHNGTKFSKRSRRLYSARTLRENLAQNPDGHRDPNCFGYIVSSDTTHIDAYVFPETCDGVRYVDPTFFDLSGVRPLRIIFH